MLWKIKRNENKCSCLAIYQDNRINVKTVTNICKSECINKKSNVPESKVNEATKVSSVGIYWIYILEGHEFK